MTEMMKKRPTLFSESGSFSRCASSTQNKQTVISYILSSMLYKSYAIFVGACEPFWCLSYVRKWDETNPDKMVRCDTLMPR